jgi:hypothetical protein
MDTERFRWLRPLAWGGAVALILFPLFAMKFADPGAWAFEDLPFAFVMIAAVGLAFELALRIPASLTFRAGAALAMATACLLTWGNLAVGFAGSEDNAINIIFFAAPAIALGGSLAVRLRSAGLALVMASAAIVQVSTGLIGFYQGYFTGPLTFSFTGLWLASSLLFLRSSRLQTALRKAS